MTLRSVRVNRPAEIARGLANARTPAPMTGRLALEVEIDDPGLRAAMEELTQLQDAARDAGEPDDDVILYRYMTQHDDRVRPHHAALHGTVWRASDPSAPRPPLGPGCRCYVEYFAEDKAAADRTGLPVAPKDAPKPGAQALQRYFEGAETAAGEQVMPTDILGQTLGRAVETGKLHWKWALDDQGNKQAATVVRGLLKETTTAARMQVERSAYRLAGLGISLGQARTIAAEAKRIVTAEGISERLAIRRVLLRDLPGFIPARTEADTIRRADRAADYLLTMLGGSL